MAYQANQTIKCDVLILGSGIAGLMLAQMLSRFRLKIILATKGRLIDSNTALAQGGIAAALAQNALDSPELHLKDTLAAGAGLTDCQAASGIINSAQSLVEKLLELGLQLDRKTPASQLLKGGSREENGETSSLADVSEPTPEQSTLARDSIGLDAALEGGHCQARVLHCKDATGLAVAQTLIESVVGASNVRVLENTFALELVTAAGQCQGAILVAGASIVSILSRHTVVATGGIGQIYERTTNPAIATGDGIALAYRAGARLIDMEFVQFHPTALVKDKAPAALISEAVRGAGAHLLNGRGERFAFAYHQEGELATRDIVARAIYTEMSRQNAPCVWLDMRPIGKDKIQSSFPNILQTCRKWNIDPLAEPVPVAPAAHYFMGGISTDLNGSTTIPGLYAIGECACTGLHGANRLASNSLLEGGVMAMRLSQFIADQPLPASLSLCPKQSMPATGKPAEGALQTFLPQMKSAMFCLAGLERTETGLRELLSSIPEEYFPPAHADRASAERANLALLGQLIALSALARRESRGAHWRTDYPNTDDQQFLKRYYVSLAGCGWLAPSGTSSVCPVATSGSGNRVNGRRKTGCRD